MNSKVKKPTDKVVRQADDDPKKFPARLNDFDIPRILPSARPGGTAYDPLGKQATTNSPADSIRRDLVTLSESAEAFLSGSKSAEAQLRNVLNAGLVRFKRSGQSEPYNYGLVSAMLQLGDALNVDKLCRDRITGRLRALQAAFTLDFASEVRGVPLTQAANATINHGLASLRGGASDRSDRPSGRGPAPDVPKSRPYAPDARADSGKPSDSLEPGFESGTDTVAPSFCDQLDGLLGQAYVDWAIGADSDPWDRRIESVKPRCVVFNVVDQTPFEIKPPADDPFPSVQPSDVDLMLGDVKINIDSWAADLITFHLPAGSRSGALRLQGPFAARSGLPARVLGQILDMAAEMIGQSARVGAGVSVGVIYPPEIKVFSVNAADVTDDFIELEACRGVARIVWQVEMQNTPGLAVPECAGLTVLLRDQDGNVLTSSTVAAGYFPPVSVGEKSVEVVATIHRLCS